MGYPAPHPPKPITPEWATEIPDRSPMWKLHANRGLARSAISWGVSDYYNARPAKLFHWNGEEWVLEFEVTRDTKPRDLPWRKS